MFGKKSSSVAVNKIEQTTQNIPHTHIDYKHVLGSRPTLSVGDVLTLTNKIESYCSPLPVVIYLEVTIHNQVILGELNT
jgi:hypothetical protein